MSNNIYDYKKWGSRIFEKEDSKKTNGVKSLKNSESNISNYKNWKAINEQEDIGKKKEKQVDQLSDEMGMDESEFIKAFSDKINQDTGEEKNIMGKVSESIRAGIVESFIYSDKTPKKFYKDPTSFIFSASNVKPSAKYKSDGDIVKDQGLWITGTSIDGGGIPYIDVDGNFKMVSQEDIITDINSKNADLRAEKKGSSQYSLIRVDQKDKPNGHKYVLKAGLVENAFALYVVAPDRFKPRTASQSTKTGTTTVTSGKDGTTTPLTFNIKLDTNEGSTSGVSFETGKSDVIGTPVESIYNALVEQAKKQGVEDISTLKITKFKIISSASNQFGGKVAATNDNSGKPTGVAHDAPVEDNPNWNVNNANLNYTLANSRGTKLGAKLLPGLKEKGISEIAEPTISPRVTDTGGLNDTAGNGKEGRNKSTHPNNGQYAQLIIEAEALGEDQIITPPTPGKKVETKEFTQFALRLADGSGKGSGLARFSNFGLSKPKYLKKGGGGFKSPGYIKRHGGGNRPTSGLAGWFDGLFYSGV